MKKSKSIVILVVLGFLIALLSVACFAKFPIGIKKFNSIMGQIGKGIDLSGGYYVVLTPESESNDPEVVEKAMVILRERLDAQGFTEATISKQDSNNIRVEIPEVDNASEVLKVIGNTGELTFRDSANTVYLTGDDVKSAYVGLDNDEGYVCVLEFTTQGIEKFSNATNTIKDMSDNKMYIYLGDQVVSQPQVNQQIINASAQITGFATHEEADAVASVIESGRLPINYSVSEARSISPRLGQTAIKNALIAGAIGLIAIFIIMIVVYKGMGIAADVALVIYTLLFIVLLAIIPNIQLTLPGICGILLSIGMAVDANVIIFERIKDEFRNGKDTMSSVNGGFKRALITVIDSNLTTILAAIVLVVLCPGTIKGFAITLLVGVILSMVTAIFITKSLLKVLLPLSSKQDKFFNLKRVEEGEANA